MCIRDSLASFYLYKQNPAMSARVLETALSNNNIEFDKANAKLLSDAWLFAKERSRSLEVIGRSLDEDPKD